MTKEYSMLVSCFITFRDLLEADDMYISSKEHTFLLFTKEHSSSISFLFFPLCFSFARSFTPESEREKKIFGELFVSDRDRCICISEWANERMLSERKRERARNDSEDMFNSHMKHSFVPSLYIRICIQVLPYYCLDIDNDEMMNMELLGYNNWPTMQSIFQYTCNWNGKKIRLNYMEEIAFEST